jgi:hypothetical protein
MKVFEQGKKQRMFIFLKLIQVPLSTTAKLLNKARGVEEKIALLFCLFFFVVFLVGYIIH